MFRQDHMRRRLRRLRKWEGQVGRRRAAGAGARFCLGARPSESRADADRLQVSAGPAQAQSTGLRGRWRKAEAAQQRSRGLVQQPLPPRHPGENTPGRRYAAVLPKYLSLCSSSVFVPSIAACSSARCTARPGARAHTLPKLTSRCLPACELHRAQTLRRAL